MTRCDTRPPAAHRYAKAARILWHDETGSPAVEFALIAPVFLLILTATFDVGAMIHKKFNLDADVSSAASYGQNLGASVADSSAVAFASTLASIAANGHNSVTTKVVLNNAVTGTFAAGAASTIDTSGTMAQCYCPTSVNRALQWGVAKTCGAACSDGAVAGRFIDIQASTPYVSLFGGLGIAPDRKVSVNAVVRLE